MRILSLRLKKGTDTQFYCGITNNIQANLERHGIKTYDLCYDCGTAEKAAAVEEAVGKIVGVSIGDVKHGGNGGVEDSKYVYVVDVNTPNFKK